MNPARPSRFVASVAVLAALSLAACGDDDDSSDTTSAAAAATTAPASADSGAVTSTGATPSSAAGEVGTKDDYVQGATDEITSNGTADPAMAGCMAEAIVSDEVYAAIQDAGVTVDQFRSGDLASNGVTVTDDQAAGIAGDMSACGDLIAQLASSADEEGCISASFSNEQVAELVVASVFGLQPSAELETANSEVGACLAALVTTTTG